MLYTEENDGVTLFLSIGETIEYESEDGCQEGQILEIDETFDCLKVLPISEDSLISVPVWISASNIIIEET